MRLGDVLLHAVTNLTRHKLRTALTLAGVGIGVATLTVFVSLGAGLQRMVNEQLDHAELVTRITVLPSGTKQQIMGGALRRAQADGTRQLDDEVVAELAALPGVIASYPDLHVPMIGCELGGQAFPAESEGLPAAALGPNHKDALLAGEYWSAQDEGPVCVVPSSLLREVGLEAAEVLGQRLLLFRIDHLRRYEVEVEPLPPDAPPDATPRRRVRRPDRLDAVEATVIGVYDTKKFGIAGGRVHLPMALAKRTSELSGLRRLGLGGPGGKGGHRALVVKVESRRSLDSVRQEVERRGFDTFTVNDVLFFVGVFFAVIDVILGFFGGIGLVVAFFGIANTMVMAVLERTREIGVYKALGARNREIRRIFLFEAAAIGALGGGLGVLAGWTGGLGLNALASFLLASQLDGAAVRPFFVPLWLGALGVGLSTVVASVAGFYPAFRAARLDPVEALRVE